MMEGEKTPHQGQPIFGLLTRKITLYIHKNGTSTTVNTCQTQHMKIISGFLYLSSSHRLKSKTKEQEGDKNSPLPFNNATVCFFLSYTAMGSRRWKSLK